MVCSIYSSKRIILDFHPSTVDDIITKKTIGLMKHLWQNEPAVQEAVKQAHHIPDYYDSCTCTSYFVFTLYTIIRLDGQYKSHC